MADNEVLIDIAGLKKDVENVNQIHNRLDTAIDRLTDVSTSIKQMLAVHEEKITRQEQTDEVIFGKLRERQLEIDTVYKELQKEINKCFSASENCYIPITLFSFQRNFLSIIKLCVAKYSELKLV